MRWTHTIHYVVGPTVEHNFKNDAEVAEYITFVAAYRDLRGLPEHDITKIVNNETKAVVWSAECVAQTAHAKDHRYFHCFTVCHHTHLTTD